jgi:hypothetical protein
MDQWIEGKWRRELFQWELQTLNQTAGGKYTEASDCWWWKQDQGGKYTVKTTYKGQLNGRTHIPDLFLAKIWNKLLPLKLCGFVWRLALNRVLTKANLVNQNMMSLSKWMYLGCQSIVESFIYSLNVLLRSCL